ncbi:ABC transporter ATP-binding protein [Arthrobacter sp. BF1]|uniref:ABC transporter ATP-binding protein n=1 Tax=Arthrobacter sp. BF1 TaxID=2821145 RepID=UPI001C4F977F|nr:ABC transporter ATP-binding protein [Arthrobacter sp. BF1]
MLTAQQLHVAGRRHTLLPATTAEAHRGEVLLIQADGQERRTALALALTGRMKPSTGSVTLGHDASRSSLRRRSALVDSPNVNAPEHHLTARSMTAEDLALVPLKFRDRTRPTAWLVKHGFRDVLDQWIEELAPERLLHLQLELALANRDVELLVLDSPDRHTADISAWLPLMEAAAAGDLGHGDDPASTVTPRPIMVIGVVGRLPEEWHGPAVIAGNAVTPETSKHDGDEPPAATPVADEMAVEELGLEELPDDEEPGEEPAPVPAEEAARHVAEQETEPAPPPLPNTSEHAITSAPVKPAPEEKP